jgi:hypothetical protein
LAYGGAALYYKNALIGKVFTNISDSVLEELFGIFGSTSSTIEKNDG